MKATAGSRIFEVLTLFMLGSWAINNLASDPPKVVGTVIAVVGGMYCFFRGGVVQKFLRAKPSKPKPSE